MRVGGDFNGQAFGVFVQPTLLWTHPPVLLHHGDQVRTTARARITRAARARLIVLGVLHFFFGSGITSQKVSVKSNAWIEQVRIRPRRRARVVWNDGEVDLLGLMPKSKPPNTSHHPTTTPAGPDRPRIGCIAAFAGHAGSSRRVAVELGASSEPRSSAMTISPLSVLDPTTIKSRRESARRSSNRRGREHVDVCCRRIPERDFARRNRLDRRPAALAEQGARPRPPAVGPSRRNGCGSSSLDETFLLQVRDACAPYERRRPNRPISSRLGA